MPATIAGVLAFAFLAGPGLLFVRGEARVRPRARRSPLTEAIEVFVAGAIPAGIALAGMLALASWEGWLSVRSFITGPGHYFHAHPYRIVVLGVSALLLSYAITGLWVFVRVRRSGTRIGTHDPDASVWYRVVTRALAGERTEIKTASAPFHKATVLALVELLDGREVSGYFHALDTDTENPTHEVSLRSPLYVRHPSEPTLNRVNADFIVIPTEQIRYMTVKSRTTNGEATSEPKISRRQKRAAKKKRTTPASANDGE